MSNSGNNDKIPEEYSEKDQWNDDLDLPPINHKTEPSKKPILEKAEFDRKKKKKWIPIVIVISIIAISSPFILNTCNNDNSSSKQNLISEYTEIDDSTYIEENILNES
ncbi:MAG: hypothetical protein ACPH90_01050, partial [Crocinitomicaceae bacterium]